MATSVTLKALLEATRDAYPTRQERIVRWRAYFAAHGHGELFDQLVDGNETELPFDFDRAVNTINNISDTVSNAARRYILESLKPENIGVPTEELCRRLKIDYERILEESLTPAYKEYATGLHEADLDQLLYNLRKTILTTLQQRIQTEPLAGFEYLEKVASNERTANMLGMANGRPKELSGGVTVTQTSTEFKPPEYEIMEGQCRIRDDDADDN